MTINKLDFLQQKKKNIEEEIMELYSSLQKAGEGTIGEIQNKIERLENLLEYYDKKIKKLEGATIPEKTEIFVYVLCTDKENIANIVNDDALVNLIPTNQYGEKQYQWQPYCNQDNIQFLLESFRKKEGYIFNEIYLDGPLKNETHASIDKHIQYSIAIIDLLSLSEDNSKTCIRFDTRIMGNIVVPICDDLPNDLTIFMKQKRKAVFKAAQVSLDNHTDDFYQPNLGEMDTFFRTLRRTFTTKFKIINTIKDRDSDKSDAIKNINPKLD